jgi:hypothetical protein
MTASYFKQCNTCHRTLSLESFSKSSSNKDGLDHKCKECKHQWWIGYSEVARKRTEKMYQDRAKHPDRYSFVSMCGKRFGNIQSRANHQVNCKECKEIAAKDQAGENTMPTQTDEPTFMSRCGKPFTNPQKRHIHENGCVRCNEIEQSIPPINKDETMETITPVIPNGHDDQNAWINDVVVTVDDTSQAEAPQLIVTHIAKSEQTAPPLLVRVGSYLIAISQIVLIDIRKNNTVDVVVSALQINNEGRTESKIINLPEADGAALITTLSDVTKNAPGDLLEKLRSKSTELEAVQRRVKELENDIDRYVKDSEAATELALRYEEKLNRIKALA